MTDAAELEELSREIRKVIAENNKFLDRIMDEEFEPDDEEEEEGPTLIDDPAFDEALETIARMTRDLNARN